MSDAANRVEQIEAGEAQRLIREGKAVLVDVREPHEQAEERIDAAVLLPLSAFDPGRVPAEPGKLTIFQCASGMRSQAAAEAYLASGTERAANLVGGINAWRSAGLPTVRDGR